MDARLRRLLQLLAIAAVLYAVVAVAGGIVLAELALHPQRRSLLDAARARQSLTQEFHVPVDDVSISAQDGATLRAWFIAPSHPSGSAVILLHGVADNREGMIGYAALFLRHGYAVLLPDSRAHGESGGAIATYGALERYDVQRWAAWLQPHAPRCEYLFGESMGAAIAIESAPVLPRLCAVAAEASFATFDEIANDRIAQRTGLGLWFPRTVGALIRDSGLAYARLRYHVWLDDADPAAALAHSRVPTLLICGTADDNIPMRHSLQLYLAGRGHSSIWIVPGAQHTGADSADPALFEQRVTGWFAEHAANATASYASVAIRPPPRSIAEAAAPAPPAPPSS
jgi:fermentation-respiration switch protein FrsA (DUF1100 family)